MSDTKLPERINRELLLEDQNIFNDTFCEEIAHRYNAFEKMREALECALVEIESSSDDDLEEGHRINRITVINEIIEAIALASDRKPPNAT